MSLADEATFTAAELAAVKEIEADAVTDAFRDRERDAWVEFTKSPSIDTRRAHFEALMGLIRAIDTRAELLLLKGGA